MQYESIWTSTRVDLNLLRLFDAVYRTRNVSRAAEAPGPHPAGGQPGPHAAAPALVHDPLFMRSARRRAPTPRAERLAPRWPVALATLQQALCETERFDPAQLAPQLSAST
jgi:DNA-binding transcriptional LysR family regulator